jgi:uncharacterized protein YciI
LFAVRHTPGPKWVAGTAPNAQPGIEEHIEYVRTLHEHGIVFGAGPFLDGAGGMTVLRAASMDEARAAVEADPAVRRGLLVAEIHPWRLVFEGGSRESTPITASS